MDITQLIAKLRSDTAASQQVVLNTDYLSDKQVSTMQGMVGLPSSRYVTIKQLNASDIPDADGNTVTITAGQADLLNQTAMPVKELVFTVTNDTVDIILQLVLPASWTWTDSFPRLTIKPFSLLTTLSDSCFIYSTTPQSAYQVSASGQIPLALGLNFSCLTNVSQIPKLPDILGASISDNLRLYGAVDLTGNYAYPVMTLWVPLADTISLKSLKLGGLQLKIETTAPSGFIQKIHMGLLATDGHFDLLFQLDSTSSLVITVSCTPHTAYAQTVTSLSQLSNSSIATALINGPSWHFENFVPATLISVFDSISFEAGLSLTFSPDFKVREVKFMVYTKQGVTMPLGLFTLSNFQLNFRLTSPDTTPAAYVHMSMAAKIPLKTFTSDFIGTIDISTSDNTNTNGQWQIDTITASYPGIISFNDLINELEPGITIPGDLLELSFDDFSLNIEPTGDEYSCVCYGELDINLFDVQVHTKFALVITHSNNITSYNLSAHINVGESLLNVDITLGSSNIVFTGTAQDISLTDLLVSIFSDINIDLTVLPEILLSEINITYNNPVGKLSIDGTLNYNGITGVFHLVGEKVADKWQFIAMAGFDLNPTFDVGTHIPLVGSELTGDFILKKGYLIITSQSPQSIPPQDLPSDLPSNPPAGISFYFDITLIGTDIPITLPILAYSPDFTAVMSRFNFSVEDTDSSSGNTAYTINIGKNLGPLYIGSISLTFKDQVIYGIINGSMTVGPFNAALDGLGIGTSLSAFTPSFSLDGLSFDFTSASFTIDGALIRIPDSQLAQDVSLQFDGALIIKIQQFGLAALGSYAQMTDGTASFFIFLNADFPPGGPPFFMISGLMGGFGYNRTLTLPTFNQVQSFPLLTVDAPQTDSQKDIALNTLEILEGQKAGKDGTTKQWVSPRSGDYWAAVGIVFNSFEIINGELLLTAELGKDMQFSLLGLSWLTLPQKAIDNERLVFIELQMSAVLQPQEGFLGIAASLTSNSFVLTKDCHITGGFAFYLWYGDNPNAGQFVVTAGGYHPAFKVPSYYPEVARLGFNWQVSSDVSIKGGAYFAFTPSCAMAGGRLQAQYQSGALSAWFDAGANFLVTWHPLTFVANIWVEIGVSLTIHVWFIHKTLSASIGASLDMWGPPIGGLVRIHVVFVTFQIRFGSDSAADANQQPLDWTEFKQLLPVPQDRYTIIANKGLSKILEKDATGQIIHNGDTTNNPPTTKVWFVRAGRLQFTTKSCIPATSLTYGNDGQQRVEGASGINIRPMNIASATAEHNVTITKDTANGAVQVDIDGWTFTANRANVAATLWGPPIIDNGQFVQAPVTPSADTLGQQLTGYTVTGPVSTPGSTFGIVEMRLLLMDYISQKDNPQNPLSKAHTYSDDYTPQTSGSTLTDISTIGTTLAAARNTLYAELQQDQLYSGSNDNMLQMGATVNSLFIDIPMEQTN
ncbi:DUF6603 domain-containing protein [Chitinophaga sp. 22536]|uniref:DUF6603 domain-containing protein n=1 Tax=unclassified Chitinophaga TaxID=2619133 RepID=UPI003F86FEFF